MKSFIEYFAPDQKIYVLTFIDCRACGGAKFLTARDLVGNTHRMPCPNCIDKPKEYDITPYVVGNVEIEHDKEIKIKYWTKNERYPFAAKFVFETHEEAKAFAEKMIKEEK